MSITVEEDIMNVTQSINIIGTTSSTNTSTGALKVAGGVGIAENLNVGNDLSVTGTTTLSNLNVNGTTTLTDNITFFQDDLDNTKKMQVQLSGITAGNTRILTIPDTNDTLVTLDFAQALTNKNIDSSTNTVMAGKLQTSTGAVTISSSAAPSNGQILVASSATSAIWSTIEATRIGYSLTRNEIIANTTAYTTVAYMPWDNSRYSTYTNGLVIFETVIGTRNLSIRLRDTTNSVDLGSLTGISSTGFYTFSIINPTTDARMELQVLKSAVGGTNPSVFGITLEYDIPP